MTDDEIMGLVAIVSRLAACEEPFDNEVGDCVLCGNMIFFSDRSGPAVVVYTQAERVAQHAPDCPWRRARELFS